MKTFQAAALAAVLGFTGAAQAASFSFTGVFNQDNDVQLFNFNVGAPSSVTLRTWSYAGGVNAAGNTIARGGFDPILALFDASTGARINQNDDGGPSNVAADTVTGAYFDTFLNSPLAAGQYTVAVMQFDNFPIGPNLSNGFPRTGQSNFTSGFGCANGQFCDVTRDSRTANWAFDILGVESAEVTTRAVPVPAALPLLAAGLGVFGFFGRRRRNA